METKSTNKKVLIKGLKYMGFALLLMFIGPSLLYLILSNDDKPFYTILLILSILICLSAIVIAFYGIKTIIDSLFK